MTISRRLIFVLTLILFTSFSLVGFIWLKNQRVARREAKREAAEYKLINAIKQNDTKTVLLLLQNGADPNSHDYDTDSPPFQLPGWPVPSQLSAPTALLVAVGDLNNDESLQEYIPPPENLTVVKALLDHGADVNAQDASGWTPLIYALSSRRMQSAGLILDHGADVNKK